MDEKLIEKIKKLLALSESSNENEAKIAMLKAQELLAKHKLSIKEIKDYKIADDSIREKISSISFRQGKWKAKLGGLISENFGCYQYFKTNKSQTIAFFGREEDIIVCNIVLEYAVDSILSTVKSLRYQYFREGYSSNIKFKGSINTNTSFKGYTEAYEKGKEDGEKFSISNKITEGKTEDELKCGKVDEKR